MLIIAHRDQPRNRESRFLGLFNREERLRVALLFANAALITGSSRPERVTATVREFARELPDPWWTLLGGLVVDRPGAEDFAQGLLGQWGETL